MKAKLMVKDVHAQMGAKPSAVDPNRQVTVPIWQVVMQAEHGATQFNVAIITTDKETAERFEIGQDVEVNIRTLGRLRVIGEEMHAGDFLVPVPDSEEDAE